MTTRIYSDFRDDEIIASLLAEFVNDATAQVGALQAAAASDERKQLKALAHRLKGSAATFGFPLLAQHAGNVEQLAKNEATPHSTLIEATNVVTATIACLSAE